MVGAVALWGPELGQRVGGRAAVAVAALIGPPSTSAQPVCQRGLCGLSSPTDSEDLIQVQKESRNSTEDRLFLGRQLRTFTARQSFKKGLVVDQCISFSLSHLKLGGSVSACQLKRCGYTCGCGGGVVGQGATFSGAPRIVKGSPHLRVGRERFGIHTMAASLRKRRNR